MDLEETEQRKDTDKAQQKEEIEGKQMKMRKIKKKRKLWTKEKDASTLSWKTTEKQE